MRCVYYDLDNTLYDRSVPFIDAFKQFFGDKYSQETAQEAYISCNICSNEVFADSQTGKITMNEMYIYRYQEGLRRIGIAITPDEALYFQKLYKQSQCHLTLTPVMEQVLNTTAERFDRIAVITNGPGPHQREKAESLGLEKWTGYDHIFISGEMGMMKPNASIYLRASEIVGSTPEDSWMIGDSYSNDLVGAMALGWHTVWYNCLNDPLPEGAEAPEFTVYNEEELLALIKRL